MNERFDRLLSDLCNGNSGDGNEGTDEYREERLCADIEEAYGAAARDEDAEEGLPDLGLYLEYLVSSLVATQHRKRRPWSVCKEVLARFFRGVCAACRGAARQAGAEAAARVRESVVGRLLEIARFEDYPAAAKRLAWTGVCEALRHPELGSGDESKATAAAAVCEAVAGSGLRNRHGAVRAEAVRALGVAAPSLLLLPHCHNHRQKQGLSEETWRALGEGLEGVLCVWGTRGERLGVLGLLLLRTRTAGPGVLEACPGLLRCVRERATQDEDAAVRGRAYRVALCSSGELSCVEACVLVDRGLADTDRGVRAALLDSVAQRWCVGGSGDAAGLAPVCAALVPACGSGAARCADVEDSLAEELCCRLVRELWRHRTGGLAVADGLHTLHGCCRLFPGTGGEAGRAGGRWAAQSTRCLALVWRALAEETGALEWPFTLRELAEALGDGTAASQDPFVARQLVAGARGLRLQYDVAGSAALEKRLVALLSAHTTSRSLIPHLLAALRAVVPDEDEDEDEEDGDDEDEASGRNTRQRATAASSSTAEAAAHAMGVGILRGVQQLMKDMEFDNEGSAGLAAARARVCGERALWEQAVSPHLWHSSSGSTGAAATAGRVLVEQQELAMEERLLRRGGTGGAGSWRRLDVLVRWVAVFRGFLALFRVRLLDQAMLEPCFASTASPALKAAAFDALALLQLRRMNPALVAALFPKVLAHDPAPLLRATAAKALFDYAICVPPAAHSLRATLLAALRRSFSFDMAGRHSAKEGAAAGVDALGGSSSSSKHLEQQAQAEVYLAFVEGYAKLAASSALDDLDDGDSGSDEAEGAGSVEGLCATLIVAHAVSGVVSPAIAGRARGAARAALCAVAHRSPRHFRALGAAALAAALRIAAAPAASVEHSAAAALPSAVVGLCVGVMAATQRPYARRLLASFRRHFAVDLLRHVWDNPLGADARLLLPLLQHVVVVVVGDGDGGADPPQGSHTAQLKQQQQQQQMHLAHLRVLATKLLPVLRDNAAARTLRDFAYAIDEALGPAEPTKAITATATTSDDEGSTNDNNHSNSSDNDLCDEKGKAIAADSGTETPNKKRKRNTNSCDSGCDNDGTSNVIATPSLPTAAAEEEEEKEKEEVDENKREIAQTQPPQSKKTKADGSEEKGAPKHTKSAAWLKAQLDALYSCNSNRSKKKGEWD